MQNKVVKWTFRVFSALLAFLVLLVGYFIIEDQSYPAYEFRGIPSENRVGLLITWEPGSPKDSWSEYQETLSPALKEMHANGAVSCVFPFEHASIKHPEHPATWSHSVFVVFAEAETQDEQALQLSKLAQTQGLKAQLRSIDLLRLQNGLDRFYPIRNGHRREQDLDQSLEFVFSKPEARAQYYQDQYRWSGPAMADLHSRDKAGRFVGFEVKKRLFGAEDMPEWDLVHIFGFTPWQTLKATPVFMSTWNKHARRVFGPDATFQSVIASWSKIRMKLQQEANQRPEFTLQAKGN